MTRDFFENAPCGYFSFFDDGTIFIVNETLCSLLGYKKSELDQRHVEGLFTLPTKIFYQTHFFPLVKMQGHVEEIFLTLLTKNNQYLPILLNAKRTEEPKAYTSCAFIVVPNRKKFEDELVNARNAAENALKENSQLQEITNELEKRSRQLDRQMQTVSKQNNELKQLNHVVTHSLKEPIRKILVYSEKMQLEGLPEKMMHNVSRLTKASEQMRTIVAGLQQYVWILGAEQAFKTLDLNPIIQQVAAQVREEHHPALLSLLVSDLPPFEADRDQVELLIYHILSNAVNFRKDDHARVSITGTMIKLNSFRAIKEKYRYEDFLKLEIRDEGTGFDPKYRESIFELFKRLDYTKGQGLGLALCKKIAENHSGFIEAYSQVNEYTIITIFLPFIQSGVDSGAD